MHPGTNTLIHFTPRAAGHGVDDNGALFRPIRNNRTRRLDKALTPDAVYKVVHAYLAVLGFEIGTHALRATAATNEAFAAVSRCGVSHGAARGSVGA